MEGVMGRDDYAGGEGDVRVVVMMVMVVVTWAKIKFKSNVKIKSTFQIPWWPWPDAR